MKTNVQKLIAFFLLGTAFIVAIGAGVSISMRYDHMRVFNPMNYGAVGDGSTDDSIALSNCLFEANQVRFPVVDLGGRTYKTDLSLLITNRDFTLQNGKLLTENNSIKLVDVQNDRFTGRRLFLGGPGVNWTENSFGFHFQRPGTYIQRPVLEEIKITNFWHGVKFISAVEAKIEHSQITACGSNSVWAIGCDGLVIRQSVLGNSIDYILNLADPGVGTAESKVNAMAFWFDGGQRQIVENCDINASGNVGYVWNTSSGTPHFTFRDNNCEGFWNPDRGFLMLSNISYTIERNRFSQQGALVLDAIKAYNCINSKSHVGPNLDGGVASKVRIIGGTLPFIEGFWNNNQDNNIIVYSATEGGAQTTYGQTVVPSWPLQTRFTSQLGDAQAGFLLGGNATTFGVSNNTAKKFTFAIPSYGNQTPVGFMVADMYRDNNNALVLGSQDNNTAMRYVDIKTSSDSTYLSPVHLFRFSSNGMNAVYAGAQISAKAGFHGAGTGLTNLSWTNLINVPAGFADGTDDGGGGSTYTNNTSNPGVITGSGIGTNLTVVTNIVATYGNSGPVTNGQSAVIFGDVTATGTITATNVTATGVFTGSGASLTALPAGQLTGTIPWAVVANSPTITTNAGTLTSDTFLVGNGGRGATAQAGYTTTTLATNPPIATTWSGTTNGVVAKANGEYLYYSTSADIAITNVSGTGWATLCISNSSASTITGRITDARIAIIGSGSTNALAIPSAKRGFFSLLQIGNTNVMTAVQQ